jgi:hypothetical protein
MPNALVVFTSRSISELERTGGSQAWRLRPANAKAASYLVCARNRKSDRNQGTEEHGEGFLVARITGIVPAPEDEARRFMVTFDEWAPIKLPGLWQFGRNPVHYANLDELGIDKTKLRFRPRKKSHPAQPNAADRSSAKRPLTIEQAKRGLAATFGVNVDAIEITIRG